MKSYRSEKSKIVCPIIQDTIQEELSMFLDKDVELINSYLDIHIKNGNIELPEAH